MGQQQRKAFEDAARRREQRNRIIEVGIIAILIFAFLWFIR